MQTILSFPMPCPTFKAFDQHLNMVLGDVEEIHTVREIDEETEEEFVKVNIFHVKQFRIHSTI